MVTSFSPSGNWWGLNKGILLKNLRWRFDNWFFIRWLCSLPPITVASLTMPEAWCPLMRPSCAHSRWNIRYKNTNIGRLYRGPIIVIVIYNLFLWTNLSRVHNKISIIFQILKPSEKKAKYQYQGINRWHVTWPWYSCTPYCRETFPKFDNKHFRPQTPRGPQNNPGMKRKWRGNTKKKRIHEKSGGYR